MTTPQAMKWMRLSPGLLPQAQQISLNYHCKCEQWVHFASGGFFNFNGTAGGHSGIPLCLQILAPRCRPSCLGAAPRAALPQCFQLYCHFYIKATCDVLLKEVVNAWKPAMCIARQACRYLSVPDQVCGGGRRLTQREAGTAGPQWRTWTCPCGPTWLAGGPSTCAMSQSSMRSGSAPADALCSTHDG